MANQGAPIFFSKVLEVLYIHPTCHPGKPVSLRIVKGKTAIVNCFECHKEIGRFSVWKEEQREPLPEAPKTKSKDFGDTRITFTYLRRKPLKEIPLGELKRIMKCCQEGAYRPDLIQTIQHYLKVRNLLAA